MVCLQLLIGLGSSLLHRLVAENLVVRILEVSANVANDSHGVGVFNSNGIIGSYDGAAIGNNAYHASEVYASFPILVEAGIAINQKVATLVVHQLRADGGMAQHA